jgi:glycerol-1-phosphate dehydrogenase [NAD(P)+]
MTGMQLCEDRQIARGNYVLAGELAARHKLGSKILLVCDDKTYVAAGERIYTQLIKQGYDVKPYSLGRNQAASYSASEELAAAAADVTGMIAVGSGTVNDTAKYAATLRNIPYISVATAASMNGYTSATSSLDKDGIKSSFAANPPRAVLADLDIIAAAPRYLARAGMGDTLCRTTVEADCLLSHLLLGTPYPREDFERLRSHESTLIGQIAQLKEASPDYLTTLMTALLDAGDAMARVGSSITASQGEHMIAHTKEMIYGNPNRLVHGQMIAVTALTMHELQTKLLLAQPTVRSLPRNESDFVRTFGRKLGPHLVEKYAPKVLSDEQAEQINAHLEQHWPDIRAAINNIMVPLSVLQRSYVHGNIPGKPSELNLTPERYENAVTYAYLTRDRFTFLDISAMRTRRTSN